jgi:hypothetical protein
MPTTESSGTQSATVGTEHSLATITTSRVLVLTVDAVNMANGDALELRVKTRVLSGGTNRLAYMASYANVQADPVKISVPVVSMHSCEFTLKQTAGTGRGYDWSVVSA